MFLSQSIQDRIIPGALLPSIQDLQVDHLYISKYQNALTGYVHPILLLPAPSLNHFRDLGFYPQKAVGLAPSDSSFKFHLTSIQLYSQLGV